MSNKIDQYLKLVDTAVNPFYKLNEDIVKSCDNSYKDFLLNVTSRKHKIKKRKGK